VLRAVGALAAVVPITHPGTPSIRLTQGIMAGITTVCMVGAYLDDADAKVLELTHILRIWRGIALCRSRSRLEAQGVAAVDQRAP
jgi:hypothetical protein